MNVTCKCSISLWHGYNYHVNFKTVTNFESNIENNCLLGSKKVSVEQVSKGIICWWMFLSLWGLPQELKTTEPHMLNTIERCPSCPIAWLIRFWVIMFVRVWVWQRALCGLRLLGGWLWVIMSVSVWVGRRASCGLRLMRGWSWFRWSSRVSGIGECAPQHGDGFPHHFWAVHLCVAKLLRYILTYFSLVQMWYQVSHNFTVSCRLKITKLFWPHHCRINVLVQTFFWS